MDNREMYDSHRNVLPDFNFAPWGWRNQPYLFGIMTGRLQSGNLVKTLTVILI